MTIDKNIFTKNFVNWFKEMNTEEEGKTIIKNSTLNEMIVLYERTTGKSSRKL